MKHVGHKGADLIAPGNTLASFDAALEAGVDMIEFDVLPEYPDGRGRLVLAHDYADAGARETVTLEEGLAHFAAEHYADVELDVDLKLPGYEQRVVDALRAYGLTGRALISTQYRESIDLLRDLAPEVARGWSVPKLRRDPTRSPLTALPAYAVLAIYRERLPRRAAFAILDGACHALMAHHRLITPALVRAVDEAGGELYAWTVDELPQIRALEALGVTGVISNDPRLFAAPA